MVVGVGLAYGQGLLLSDYEPIDGGRQLDPFFPGALSLVVALPALAAFGVISTAG